MNRLEFLALSLLLGGTLACTREDRGGLERRPIPPPAQDGWARLRLDGAAQRAAGSLWIGDAEGRSIPFLREREGLWAPQDLETRDLLLGRDDRGRPTAEFGLKLPKGWQVRDREHLRVDLDLDGESPWAAQLLLARREGNGAWVNVERGHPAFVYDLGSGHTHRHAILPWEGDRFRITLEAAQGKAPKWNGLRVSARTEPEALDTDEVLAPRPDALPNSVMGGQRWSVTLPSPERVVALDVALQPPAAPLGIEIEFAPELVEGRERRRPWGSGMVWNLPALHTESTRVALSPAVTGIFRLQLPEGAALASVKVLVRREALLFPAEAGKAYFLHQGGRPKEAPGNLGALPPCRQVYGRAALSLGPSEPDSQGLGRLVEGGERTRSWLPWAVGGAVAVLLGFALTLLKGPKAGADS